jgi:hypothetical protein
MSVHNKSLLSPLRGWGGKTAASFWFVRPKAWR